MKKLLLLFLFALLPGLAAAQVQNGSGSITASGGTPSTCYPPPGSAAAGKCLVFVNFNGAYGANFEELPVGSPTSVSVSVYGCMRGGTCSSAADTNTSTSAAIRPVTFTAPYDAFVVVATTLSGGTTPSMTINLKLSTANNHTGGGGGSFTAAGDLSGSNTSQEVVGLLSNPLPGLSTGNLNWNGTTWNFSTAGNGTVTSAALTLPSWLTVGGSPITSSGTFAVTPTSGQTSHQVIGTCNAATTFAPCALVAADLPSIPLTTGVTGILPAANGGTGVNNSATFTLGSANVNLGTLGTGFVYNTTTTGALTNATAAQAATLIQGLTGCNVASNVFTPQSSTCVAPTAGGNVSNSGTPTSGQLAEWTNATTIQGVAATLASSLFANQGATGLVLHGNAAGNPSWSAVALTTDVTGVLPAANGGTGVNNTATFTLGSSNVNLATLGTGIVKNTTTTGALTDAAAADVYGLFTSCTGSSGLFLKDGGTCAAAGSGTVNSGTSGHIGYYATSSTAISSDSNLDDGATVASTLTYSGSGGINASGGPVGAAAPSGKAGMLYLPGNTANQTIPANNFGIAGFTSTSATAYGWQPSSTAPSGTQFMMAGTPSSGWASVTYESTVTAGQGGTGVANTATLTLGTSNQNWATLGTGIVKNTTTTGAISDAASADVIGLWTGTCSSTTFLRGDGACQTPAGSGTVSSGTIHQVAIYAATGTTVSGDSALTDTGTLLTYTGGSLAVGSSAPTPTPGTAGGMYAVNGTVPTGLTSGNSGWYASSANSCFELLSGSTDQGCADALNAAQTFTAAKTFTNSDLLLLGSSTGATTFTSANASSTAYTLTIPANTGTLAELNLAETWAAAQTFTNSDLLLLGSSTGATTFTSANASGTAYTVTVPANTGTLAELNLAQTFSAVQTISAANGLVLSAMTGTACLEEVSGVVTSTGSACGAGSPALSSVTGASAQATGTESAAGDNYTFAGVETGNLTSYITVINTNSSNSNTSIGQLVGAVGTSTGGIGQVVFDVSGTGDIARWYSGGSVSNGTYTVGTLEMDLTAVGQLNLAGNTVTAGSGGGFDCTEGTNPTAQASHDQVYCDSTDGQLLASQHNFANAASVKFFPLEVDAINTQTASYSVVAQDSTVLCNKTTAMTITLISSGIPSGKTYHVKNIGVGTCTVSGVAIDGYASGTGVSLAQYQAVTLKFDGTQYWLF